MMKRTFLFLLLLSSLMCLNAEVFRSNQIGQKLEKVPEVLSTGYFIMEENGARSLYSDGILLWTEYTTNEEGDTVVLRTYPDSSNELRKVYRDGRLVLESEKDSGIRRDTSYAYSDGKLIFSSTEDTAGGKSVLSFLRSSDTGQIVGISDNGSIRFMSSSYLVQDGKLLESLVPGLVVSGEHTVLEDGNIQISEDNGVTSIYSNDGLLLSTVSGNRQTSYMYEDNKLICTESVDGNVRETTNYENGRAKDQYYYEYGELVSHLVFNDEGNIKTLYRNGRVVAVVYYRRDNRTVDRIEYN